MIIATVSKLAVNKSLLNKALFKDILLFNAINFLSDPMVKLVVIKEVHTDMMSGVLLLQQNTQFSVFAF